MARERLLEVGIFVAAWIVSASAFVDAGETAGGSTDGSERTVMAGIEIDRHGARVVGWTVKGRPYLRRVPPPEPIAHDPARPTQVEVTLFSADGRRHVRRVPVGPICLEHGPDEAPHVAGDTVRLHRDSFVVELPEVAGLDRVEVAVHRRARSALERQVLGGDRLDRVRFRPAGAPVPYEALAIAEREPSEPASATTTAADVLWPEDFGDTELFRVDGDAAAVGSRINVVIIPDGYTYADKALMDAHADAFIAHARDVTPLEEHGEFLNFILVYAYSVEQGTDQCDCDIVRNTAMGTRFFEVEPVCGADENRCLLYGDGCDTNANANLIDAELRAPGNNVTVLMVNTARFGGCSSGRAAYSAAHPVGHRIAVHELGHALAGLADEYAGTPQCGFVSSELNTSTNPVEGAWPEWIADLGAPVEGAHYFDDCIFRPTLNCLMRTNNSAFCPVCRQQWALRFFGHVQIAPTAPITSATPPAPSLGIPLYIGEQLDFAVETRLAQGPAITNRFTWTVQEAADPQPTVTAQDTATYSHTFDEVGSYTVEFEVVADTNYIKPQKWGANVETTSWVVNVSDVPPPPEISPPGAPTPLQFFDGSTLFWENATGLGVTGYHVYRAELDAVPSGQYGTCLVPGLTVSVANVVEDPPAGTGWAYLVTGVNAVGEGPMGSTADGAPRFNWAPCP